MGRTRARHQRKVPFRLVSITLSQLAGDIMANKAGVEHRYLPLTNQAWVVRIGGGADAELIATNTGPTSSGPMTALSVSSLTVPAAALLPAPPEQPWQSTSAYG